MGRSGTRPCQPLEDAEFAARRDCHALNAVPGHLRDGIERAQRLQFVAKEFQAHRPRAGEREDIDDAAAQGEFALVVYLHLGFVALVFQPLDEVERIDVVALLEDARAFTDLPGLERALEQGGDARDDERGVAGGLGIMVRQRNESFQPFADDIRVRDLNPLEGAFVNI